MLAHIKAACKNSSREFAGALLRPYGSRLLIMQKMGAPVDDILNAAKEAGRQFVADGEMSAETLSIISRELVPLEEYVKAANVNFQQSLDMLRGKSLTFWEFLDRFGEGQ